MSPADPTFEPPQPSSSSEYVTALAHYHRAEMARMSDWRARIDQTSNWAITVVAGMLSISLSTPSSHHGVLLFAMLIVLLLLWIEARRYRFFDVYRARVRQFERHYFAPLLSHAQTAADGWSSIVAASLSQPRFIISQRVAVTRRLRRNYIWIFAILLLAWLLKLASPRLQAEGTDLESVWSVSHLAANAALGPVPGVLVLVAVGALFVALVGLLVVARDKTGELAVGDVHM